MMFVSLLALAAAALSGCASHQGGVGEDEYYNEAYGSSPINPAPPTFRPGINPFDARDPNVWTRQPLTP